MNLTQKIESFVQESPKTLYQIVEAFSKIIDPEVAARRYDTKVSHMRLDRDSKSSKPLEYKVLMGRKYIVSQKLGDLIRRKRIKSEGNGWKATYTLLPPPPLECIIQTRIDYFIVETVAGFTAAKDTITPTGQIRTYWNTKSKTWGKKKLCHKTTEQAEIGLCEQSILPESFDSIQLKPNE